MPRRWQEPVGPAPLPNTNTIPFDLLRFSSLPIGARIEVSAAFFRITRKLRALISQSAGRNVLMVEYEADHDIGNSFHVRVLFLILSLSWG
jgi:NADH dehydrogenase [ubiquinone] 1 alpha subcomplex assembly factor 7